MKTNLTRDGRKRVLVFDQLKRLVAVFHSCTAAAKAFQASTVSIHNACIGKSISCHQFYFRHLYDDKIEIDAMEDLGELRLEDYDELVGLKRVYYKTRAMSRIGMKYKTKKNKEL